MKVLGLISGGKDSVYNLMRCREYGHEVVALANLLPADEALDELDSYMYQTVGHQLLDAYARCAEVPLFRRRIQGASRNTGLEYERTPGDEVEDLRALLAFAQQQMPEIEAVASGAIASDYQRLRVEHVCAQLGLVSLAYLWLQPQAALLQGMIDSGIEAVLVKVAALGLDPAKHLGRSLQQMQPLLHDLARRFGCNVCGEGGEYESLTLDCPLFPRARICLDAWDPRAHSPDALAPVGVLHPTAFRVVAKFAAAAAASPETQETLRPPPAAYAIEVPRDFAPEPPVAAAGILEAGTGVSLRLRVCEAGCGLLTAACTPVLAADSAAEEPAAVAATALSAALDAVQQGLAARGSGLESAVLALLWVRDMGHFAALNSAYSCHFPASRPAARACVQVPLPADTPLVLQVTAATTGVPRSVLHVQSISCWAPSCIGPYSQAAGAAGLLFFAGQIGLDPPTMRLLPGLQPQVRRCFASCEAVALAQRVHLPSALLGLTLFSTPEAGPEARAALAGALQQLLARREPEGEAGPADEAPSDSYLTVEARVPAWRPLALHVVAAALPRGAAVEVQPLCLSHAAAAALAAATDSDGSDAGADRQAGAVQNEHWAGAADVRLLARRASFCLCQASVSAAAGATPPSQELDGLAARVVAGALEGLQRAALLPADAVAMQLFVSERCCAGEQLAGAEAALGSALAAAGWGPAAPAVVLVVAVGPTEAVDALLLLQVLCWRAL